MEEIPESSGRLVRAVPETARKDGTRRRLRWLPLALAVAAVLALVIFLFAPRGGSFTVGERVPGTGIEDIVVSDQDALDPPPDAKFLSGSPEVLYVYLVGGRLPSGEFQASVESTDRTTIMSWLFSDRTRLQVGDERKERLVRSGGEVYGLIRFSIRPDDGEAVSPGNYTVTVREAGGGDIMAEKSFVVRG